MNRKKEYICSEVETVLVAHWKMAASIIPSLYLYHRWVINKLTRYVEKRMCFVLRLLFYFFT